MNRKAARRIIQGAWSNIATRLESMTGPDKIMNQALRAERKSHPGQPIWCRGVCIDYIMGGVEHRYTVASLYNMTPDQRALVCMGAYYRADLYILKNIFYADDLNRAIMIARIPQHTD